MKNYFSIALVLLLCLQLVDGKGMKCFQCKEVVKPIYCHYIATCGEGEVCGIERVVNGHGVTRYNLGCESTQVCTSTRNISHVHTKRDSEGTYLRQCKDCCTGDLCNAAGCGEQGFPKDRGPVCFNCENIEDPTRCNKVKSCEQNEKCFIRQNTEFQTSLYSSYCQKKSVCDYVGSSPSFIGRKKRSKLGRIKRSEFCTRCCDENLCNSVCEARTTSRTVPSTTTPSSKQTETISDCNDHRECSVLVNKFRICSDAREARVFCPRSCGLCFKLTKAVTTEEYIQTTEETTEQTTTYTTVPPVPKDCKDIYSSGGNDDGVYEISPDGNISFRAFCDMNNGGWTVIQRRINGAVSFDRTWTEYENGFGNLNGDFWLGLNYIHLLTKDKSEIFFNITLRAAGRLATALYRGFYIEGANQKYKMFISNYTGIYNSEMKNHINSDDGLHYHNGQQFSTKDQDNDNRASVSCSVDYNCGGYWFNSCYVFGCFNGPFNQMNFNYRRSSTINMMEIRIRRQTIK